MIWRFLPHATACIASDQLILLDLRQDRYFHVPIKIAGAMTEWLGSSLSRPAPEAVARLLERNGVWRPGDPAASILWRDTIIVPETLVSPTWLGAPERRASALHVATIVTRTWMALRRKPLLATLEKRLTTAAAPVDLEDLVSRCAAFDQARTFSPLPRRCLLDSLALSAWLSPLGVTGELVFGVAIRPFAAHCWLQAPGSLLNDSYDHVSRFTPILTT
jgi:hypothetical protein